MTFLVSKIEGDERVMLLANKSFKIKTLKKILKKKLKEKF
jgi:hypothetical protein